MVYVYLFLNVIMLVSGQIMWKTAVTGVGGWSVYQIIKVIFSPYFIAGGLFYVVGTVLWLMILSKLPFHVAYPMQSLCYVLGMLVAYFLFKEQIHMIQWFGMGFIILGVFMIAK